MQQKYDVITRCLHWIIAIGILIMIGLGLSFDSLTPSQFQTAVFIHKSLAMTLLILMIVRILWRLTYGSTPPYNQQVAHWQISAAHGLHKILYLAIFTMLFSGWLMSSWSGYPVPFWGLANVALPLAHNKHNAAIASGVHSVCAWIMIILIVLHVIGALWHGIVRRDGVLRRML